MCIDNDNVAAFNDQNYDEEKVEAQKIVYGCQVILKKEERRVQKVYFTKYPSSVQCSVAKGNWKSAEDVASKLDFGFLYPEIFILIINCRLNVKSSSTIRFDNHVPAPWEKLLIWMDLISTL